MSQGQQHVIEKDQRGEGGMVTARLLTKCSNTSTQYIY